jgi:acetate kinase
VKVLLLNAGSSSLKFTLMEAAGETVLAEGMADWSGEVTHYRYAAPGGVQRREDVPWRGHGEAVKRALHDLKHIEPTALADHSTLAAVGHRVVHGGDFTKATRITAEVRSKLAALAELAPLHNPPSLETLAAAEAELPRAPHVVVFDTAFHTTMLPAARIYPVPDAWTQQWGIRRFGFHGLSHAYCARRAAQLLQRPAGLKLVICHLGHGCSACAVRDGVCVDTTMGFTPLEGLMMATRSGSLDPSVVVHLQQRHGMSAEEVETALNRQSGLLGVSGVSADMREVLAAAQAGRERARLALELYAHRVRQAIGALTVTVGGIDALVFTAGVGENAAEVRAEICRGLDCLGLELDAAVNARCRPDADVAKAASRGRILVVRTHEELTMLQEMVRILPKS